MTSADARQPRTQFAVLEPFAAAYFLGTLKRAGITSQYVLQRRLWLQQHGHTREAHALAQGWDQLLCSARTFGVERATDEEATCDDASAQVLSAQTAPDLSQMITTAVAAAHLECTPAWITQLIPDGVLDGRKVGSSWVIRQDQVEDLAALRPGRNRAA